MKLGPLTAPFPETPLDEVADWTADNGFTTIEIACWPASSGDTRRYAGTSHIDVDGISDTQASEIADGMASRGLEISGLGYYPNPLHPDADHSRMVIDHLKKVITAAGKMVVKRQGCQFHANGPHHRSHLPTLTPASFLQYGKLEPSVIRVLEGTGDLKQVARAVKVIKINPRTEALRVG